MEHNVNEMQAVSILKPSVKICQALTQDWWCLKLQLSISQELFIDVNESI